MYRLSVRIRRERFTQNKMTVRGLLCKWKEDSGRKIDLKNENEKLLLRFSILCNDSTNTDGQEIGDPTETALINLGTNLGIDAMQVRERYPRLRKCRLIVTGS